MYNILSNEDNPSGHWQIVTWLVSLSFFNNLSIVSLAKLFILLKEVKALNPEFLTEDIRGELCLFIYDLFVLHVKCIVILLIVPYSWFVVIHAILCYI